MNHAINLVANLIQYQNVREALDGRWMPDDDESSIPYDLQNIAIAQKYIKQNSIVLNENTEMDKGIKYIVEEILSGYEDFECYSDEDWDIGTLENAAYYIKSCAELKNQYIAHRPNFTPIFEDDWLNAKIIDSYNTEFDEDCLFLNDDDD